MVSQWALPVIVAQAAGKQTAIALPVKDEVAGGDLMLAAYLFLWVFLFAYLAWSHRGQRQLKEELRRVEEKLDDTLGELNARQLDAGGTDDS